MSAQQEGTEQVLDLGRRRVEAELAGDGDALTALLAEDFVCVGPLGFMLTREQYVGVRRSGDMRQQSLAFEDVQVRLYGDAAIAVGEQSGVGSYKGSEASGRFRVTQVAVRQDRGWVIAGLHLSPIAPPPGANRG